MKKIIKNLMSLIKERSYYCDDNDDVLKIQNNSVCDNDVSEIFDRKEIWMDRLERRHGISPWKNMF